MNPWFHIHKVWVMICLTCCLFTVSTFIPKADFTSTCECPIDSSLSVKNSESESTTTEEVSSTEITTETSRPRPTTIPPPSDQPFVFVITPTYRRPSRMADMTRFSHTLMLVKNLFWIVVEDSDTLSADVSNLLGRSQIPHAYLLAPKPKKYVGKKKIGKGVFCRLKAMDWIRENAKSIAEKGVIYLADDDNSYDLRLFDEIRKTKRVSVFPVGLLKFYGVSAPIVNSTTGKVSGFHDWQGGRKFALDMAGFAVDLDFFLSNKHAGMKPVLQQLETSFLQSLGVGMDDFEPLAENCTKVYVWHTKTMTVKFPDMRALKGLERTNIVELYENVMDF